MFRGPMIGSGVEPAPMHRYVSATLQEAKPKAGSSCRPNVRRPDGPQTGVQAQKSTPSASPADRFCRSRCYSNRRSVTPTKINRGGSRGTNGMWARTGRNVEQRKHNGVLRTRATLAMWRVHPDVGVKLRRAPRRNPMNAVRTTRTSRGRSCVVRPGCAKLADG